MKCRRMSSGYLGERWLVDGAELEEEVGEWCWVHSRTRNQAVWLETVSGGALVGEQRGGALSDYIRFFWGGGEKGLRFHSE